MVVDSSALTAILLEERERPVFQKLILQSSTVVMSVVTVVEATMVLYGRRHQPQAEMLDEVLEALSVEVCPVELNHGLLARQAFVRYGRRRHPAALNFGDCFSYALAKEREYPLLYKGEDFSKTDIVPAWHP